MEGRDVGKVALSVLGCLVLYITGIGSLFFTLPLLFLDRRHPKRVTDTACVAALVLVVAWEAWSLRDLPEVSLTWPFMVVNLFIPVSLILSAMVWVGMDGKGLFSRLLWSFLPPVALFAAAECYFLLSPDAASAMMGNYTAYITGLIGLFIPLEEAVLEAFAQVLVYALLSLAPLMVAANGTGLAFIYEAAGHAGNEDFEDRLMHFKVHPDFVYVFLGLWALLLVSCFVTLPTWVVVPLLGLAMMSLLPYFLQGFAILLHFMHSRGSRMTGFKLAAWLLLIIVVLQFVNAIILISLTLLGIIENWVNLRRHKEFSDEDHS